LDAKVRLPGSKSLTARYLVLSALADGPSHLHGALAARDSRLMEQGLIALGGPGGAIDVGLAGTVMRFLAPVAALAEGGFTFDGDPAAARRPIRPLLRALADLGVEVGWPPEGSSLPFVINGRGGLAGGSVRLDAGASSQFLSALLLAAPRFEEGLTVELDPPALPSRPHVDMTIRALRQFGASPEQIGEWSWRVPPGGLTGQDLAVEPDLSNAGPFLGAALVAGGVVRVEDWPSRTDQAGDRLRDYLEAFGATVAWAPGTSAAASPGGSPAAAPTSQGDSAWSPAAGAMAALRQSQATAPTPQGDSAWGELSVNGPAGQLRGVDLDLTPAGELAPTLAALAALASSESRLVGIGHLRGHETNRLAALAREINRLGGDARELEDGLAIRPRPLHGGLVRTYGDHRMATFAALIGLAVPGVEVEDIAATDKTLPGFERLWQAMVAA
jgi:3-phosphoshikimate 1-carboxyvinyltransferase